MARNNAMNQNQDLYEILQVHHAAEAEVIEAAYRGLVRMYHPDVNKSAEAHETTVRLNRALEVNAGDVWRDSTSAWVTRWS